MQHTQVPQGPEDYWPGVRGGGGAVPRPPGACEGKVCVCVDITALPPPLMPFSPHPCMHPRRCSGKQRAVIPQSCPRCVWPQRAPHTPHSPQDLLDEFAYFLPDNSVPLPSNMRGAPQRMNMRQQVRCARCVPLLPTPAPSWSYCVCGR